MNRKIVLLLLILLLLPGVYLWLRPDPQSPFSKASTLKSLTLTIKNGQVVSSLDTLTVNKNDTVKITAISDTDDELHIHGYEKEVELKADKAATIQFKANKTGRFIIELHKADKEIAALEVQP